MDNPAKHYNCTGIIVINQWDGIDEFVAIARAGSFTAAARTFGASVTHMSRALARLEARMHTTLLHRTTRSLRLTDTGRVFFQTCDRLLEDREDAINLIRARDTPRGELRLTCSLTLGERFIAPLLQKFALAYPEVAVSLDLDNVVRDLTAEGYDLAVRTGHLADSRLIASRVASRELITVASPQYLDKAGRPTTIADLAERECLVGTSPQWHFANGRTFRPRGRWACNNGNVVLNAAIAGLGVCQLPMFYLGAALVSGAVEEILPDQREAAEPIWAIYPQRRHLSPKVGLFVALLRDELQPMLDGPLL
jgi:DNA-binding transcriptional LysR family regulator